MRSGLVALFCVTFAVVIAACEAPFVAAGTTSGSGGEAGAGGQDTSTSSSTSTSTVSSSSSGCIPKTCQDQGFNCGKADDGCGHQLFCGSCSEVEFCDMGMCSKTPCQIAVEDPSQVPNLDMTEYNFYLGVLNCVCHDSDTTMACGSDTASQMLCGMGGINTGSVTQDFFTNDPIGPCCATQCQSELTDCRGKL